MFKTKRKNWRGSGFTLIEVLIVIGIIAILAGIVIIAINPSKQFAQARNTQRTANINAILNAVGQYMADNKGLLPTEITSAKQDISSGGADLCDVLVPIYLPSLLVDPEIDPDGNGKLAIGQAVPENSCGNYDTGYKIKKDENERVEVCAPEGLEPAVQGSSEICATR